MDPNAEIVRWIDAGRAFCVALVLEADGSTPREAGTKALIAADGSIAGTIGGGPLEAAAQEAAIEACRTGRPVIIEATLDGGSAGAAEPICGGSMRVLVDPTAAKDRGAYAAAADALEGRRSGALATLVTDGDPLRTAVTWHAFRDAAEEAAPGALIEPVAPKPRLVIAGGGHVGQALARQADLVGFDVVVLDDRPEFRHPALFPSGTEARGGDIAASLAGLGGDQNTYIVVVTRGHQNDAEALAACIHAPAAYIGMIGSHRKVALTRERFLNEGLGTEAEWERVFAPVGIDIGAETVAEIATSIVAELIAVRRGVRTDSHMVDR